MTDIGQILISKTETITNTWINNIREDIEIESAKGLAYQSVRDHIPEVIEHLGVMLSNFSQDKKQELEIEGLKHGIVRAKQGYDVTEIIQEYSLLREIILDSLAEDLKSESKEKILETVKLINSVIDKVISLSLESFLQARIKELEKVRSQLVLTNQELTRLVADQKENLSYLAHELKTPLNSIIGFSNILLQQHKNVTKGQNTSLNLELTEKVINNSKHLLRLINDSLEIARCQAGKMELNLVPTNVKAIIGTAIESLEPFARQKDLDIIFNDDNIPKEVITDPLRLRQIVTNLISNAIRYTDSGNVSITCQTENNQQWLIIIADTGIGISSQNQKEVFKPYYRVSSKNYQSYDSTGLGLTIVSELVKLLQGEIHLVSELNKGSTFTLTFPLVIISN